MELVRYRIIDKECGATMCEDSKEPLAWEQLYYLVMEMILNSEKNFPYDTLERPVSNIIAFYLDHKDRYECRKIVYKEQE